MASIKYLEVADIAAIVAMLRNVQREYGEDMPPFELADVGKLSSCLEQARLVVCGQAVHKTLVDKAVWLFYGIIKNHPLTNGNKRVAVYALYEFIRRNREVMAPNEQLMHELFDVAIETAARPPADRKLVELRIRALVRKLIKA